MERFTVEFLGASPFPENRIEVTYWFDETGAVTGEAYFKRDDFGAPIVNGEFSHPYTELRYKLHVPTKWGKSTDAILDVLRWSNVGRAKPVKVEG